MAHFFGKREKSSASEINFFAQLFLGAARFFLFFLQGSPPTEKVERREVSKKKTEPNPTQIRRFFYVSPFSSFWKQGREVPIVAKREGKRKRAKKRGESGAGTGLEKKDLSRLPFLLSLRRVALINSTVGGRVSKSIFFAGPPPSRFFFLLHIQFPSAGFVQLIPYSEAPNYQIRRSWFVRVSISSRLTDGSENSSGPRHSV